MAITVLYPGVEPKKVIASWTHTVGDAADTLAIAGKVLDVRAYEKLSSGPLAIGITWSVSTSGNVDTISIYSNTTLTDGLIVVEYIPR